MNKWVLKDKIKRGFISFEEGDEVVLFWRKGNGHPKSLRDGEVYIVKKIENEHLYVMDKKNQNFSSEPSIVSYTQYTRVHKTYMIPIQILREIKLNSLLDETKLI